MSAYDRDSYERAARPISDSAGPIGVNPKAGGFNHEERRLKAVAIYEARKAARENAGIRRGPANHGTDVAEAQANALATSHREAVKDAILTEGFDYDAWASRRR